MNSILSLLQLSKGLAALSSHVFVHLQCFFTELLNSKIMNFKFFFLHQLSVLKHIKHLFYLTRASSGCFDEDYCKNFKRSGCSGGFYSHALK